MNKKTFLYIVVVVVVLQAYFTRTSKASRAHVRITNMLGKGIDARIRCLDKHGGGDVEVKNVPYEGLYEFGFTPNIFGITKYNCEFLFNNISHWFQIYNEHRDHNGSTFQCYAWNK